MFASKKLFGRSRSALLRRPLRRIGRLESLEDRRMFNVAPHGGPVIPSVVVEPIYLGSVWNSDQGLSNDAHQLNQFFSYLTGTSYMDLLAQYSEPGMTIGHGSELASKNLNVALPRGTIITDADIQQSLNSWIDNGTVGRPYANELFFFFAPPDAVVTTENGDTSLLSFYGYHSSLTDEYGDHVPYAVIPNPVGNAEIPGLNTFQQQTEASSHELAEAVTDPDSNGWYDSTKGPSDGEIGDLANLQVVYLNNYAVQKLWSNAAGGAAAPVGATAQPVQPLQVTGGVNLNETPGIAFDEEIGTFYDPNSAASAGAYTIQISWEDGTDSTGTVVAEGNGHFEVFGTHTYNSIGGFPIYFTVARPDDALTGAATSEATVSSPPVQPVDITSQIPINLAPGDYTINQAMVTFVDPAGPRPLSDYNAMISWGDNQSSPGSISFNSVYGQFLVSGSHTYAGPGTYSITVQISDGSATPATTGGTVTLASPPVNNPPVITPPVITPPVITPPVITPPVITPPVITPPINNPPVVTPPIVTPPVTPPPGLTPNQEYVTAVYRAVLGTDPQPSELESWAAQIDGGLDRGAFVNSLDHSASYFATIIGPAYQQYLGRAADSAGLAYWIQQMQAGLTDEQLEAKFIGSPEFYQAAGGTDADWVEALYQHLLGRGADPQGEAWWTNALASGHSRSEVALEFTASSEREKQRVQDDYFHYLGRQASPSEADFWLNNFENGQTNEDLITGFLASPEYYQHHTS